MRYCARCYADIPDTIRRGTRFCSAPPSPVAAPNAGASRRSQRPPKPNRDRHANRAAVPRFPNLAVVGVVGALLLL